VRGKTNNNDKGKKKKDNPLTLILSPEGRGNGSLSSEWKEIIPSPHGGEG